MPRYRRQIALGSIQHIVSRFVNREFRLDVDGARQQYLKRAARSLGRSDWHPLAFALMSSHIHWAMGAGAQPPSAVFKSLHSGMAGWLNAAQQRLGPVFADRYRSLTFKGETAAALLAYIHNNPVRAGTVRDPADSSWTSHRAYLGLAPAPPWLDVELGLNLSGFSATPSGRLAFHEMVVSRAAEPRSTTLSGGDMQARRRRAREIASGPVEIGTPTVTLEHDGLRVDVPVVPQPECSVRHRWDGNPILVLQAVANETDLEVAQLLSRMRVREVTNARRIALLIWTQEFQRPAAHLSPLLGISSSSASGLTSSASPGSRAVAAALARRIRNSDSNNTAP